MIYIHFCNYLLLPFFIKIHKNSLGNTTWRILSLVVSICSNPLVSFECGKFFFKISKVIVSKPFVIYLFIAIPSLYYILFQKFLRNNWPLTLWALFFLQVLVQMIQNIPKNISKCSACDIKCSTRKTAQYAIFIVKWHLKAPFF